MPSPAPAASRPAAPADARIQADFANFPGFLQNSLPQVAKLAAGCLAIFMLLVVTGCEKTEVAAKSSPPAQTLPSDEELKKNLDEVIEFTGKRRHLNTKDHAAWQVLHGVVAFKNDFEIRHDGKLVPAVDYLLNGGELKGWLLEAGPVNPMTERRGLRTIVDAGSKTGQGHQDQWLGYMSGCDLKLDQPITHQGEQFTLEDLLAQAELDVYRNTAREYSWTLMGQTLYRPSNYEWTAGDGSQWSIAKMVESEAAEDLKTSACGGTHRLVGLTLALQRHLAQGGKLEGPWLAAHNKIRESIETIKKYQNPNGSFSSSYFIRPSSTSDLGLELSTTGHALEFLAIAMNDDEIREPWVRKAAARLLKVYRITEDMSLECGGLYHATSGLIHYRNRLFGAQDSKEVAKTSP